jgi:hypothetical protein
MLIRIEKNRATFKGIFHDLRGNRRYVLPFLIGFASFLRPQYQGASAKISVSALEPSTKFPQLEADDKIEWLASEDSLRIITLAAGAIETLKLSAYVRTERGLLHLHLFQGHLVPTNR